MFANPAAIGRRFLSSLHEPGVLMYRKSLIPTFLLGAFVSVACAQETPDDAMAEGDTTSDDAMMAEADLECVLRGATMEEAMQRTSPLRQVEFSFSGGEGLLCHSAPSVRGREIMGGVVPYDQPWRFGANEPTTLHVSADATLGSVALEPGSYALYVVPGETEWEVFVNPETERWGIPITPEVRASEIGSFTVVPEATDELVETLTFSYDGDALVMEWENTRLRLPIQGGGTGS